MFFLFFNSLFGILLLPLSDQTARVGFNTLVHFTKISD